MDIQVSGVVELIRASYSSRRAESVYPTACLVQDSK
jgi:hypothetical protein